MDVLVMSLTVGFVELGIMTLLDLADHAIPDDIKGYVDALAMALTIGPLVAWLLYRQRVTNRLAAASNGASWRAPGSPHARVRMAVVGSLAVIALIVGGSLAWLVTVAHSMSHDSQMINLAGRQRTFSQRLARYAEASTRDPSNYDSIESLLPQLEADTRTLHHLLDSVHSRRIPELLAARDSLQRSESTRAELTASARLLLSIPAGTPEALPQITRVERLADDFLPLAEHTASQLQAYSEARIERARRSAWVLAAMLEFVILVIIALVVEPVVRLLQRQHAAMTARSTEFERLAMVAQRTSNAVAITDANRLITWVNDGFERITGYTAEESIGRSPGALLQCDKTDPVTVRAIREALNRGESFRGEILNRTRDGRDYWIDLTIEPLREQDTLTGFIAIESDITDLVNARDAFEAQSRRLDMIVQSADLGTWEWDLRTGSVHFNAQWTAMLGYGYADVAQHIHTWTELSHPDDRELVAAAMRAHLKGLTPEFRCEQRFRRRDGSWCWVLAAGRVIARDAHGRAQHAVGVHLDVSHARQAKADLDAARLRAEAALREVSALRSALDEHSIISVADRTGRIIDVNTGFCRSSGYTRDELLGQDHRLLNSGMHAADFWQALWSTIAVGRPWRGEICNRRKDGSLFWVDSTIVPYVGADGQIEKYVSIRVDITAQKRADEELQRTTDLLEEAQSVARLGSWSVDQENGISWSREVYRLYGRNELDGPPSMDEILSDVVPEDAERLARAIERLQGTGTPYSLVMRTAHGANGVRYVRGEGRARRNADGVVISIFGTVMDVTAEIEREEALRLAQATAEAASVSKSEFLANMSHEIRTPLTAILGYADLLRDEAERIVGGQDCVPTIDTIRRAGEHLLNVINDILDVSKIEAGRMMVESIETHLPRVLFDVDSLMRARAAGKGVTLRTSLATPIPERILSDPTRLRQILMNLVGNAAKFTEQGRIDIRVSTVDGPQGQRLRIAVEDTGPGMSPDQAARLFQAFTQADSSVTRRHGGTGLGLTICRRLAELMGGNVSLAWSTPGAGSCFELSLPLVPVAGAPLIRDFAACTSDMPQEATITREAIRLRGRILLAEDGEDNQRLISHHLRAAGAEVVIVDNGLRALQTLREADLQGTPFDLLVTDMQMPEMDGYTLARTLRADTSRIPIVALTAHAMAEDRALCLAAGCDDYASKPIDKWLLLETCARWLNTDDNVMDIFPTPRVITNHGDAPALLYSEMRDDPELGGLVAGFVSALPTRLDRFAADLAVGDVEAVARRAHQMKGAAGGFGFPSIGQAAGRLESVARQSAPTEVVQEALLALVAQCHAAMRAHPASTESAS